MPRISLSVCSLNSRCSLYYEMERFIALAHENMFVTIALWMACVGPAWVTVWLVLFTYFSLFATLFILFFFSTLRRISPGSVEPGIRARSAWIILFLTSLPTKSTLVAVTLKLYLLLQNLKPREIQVQKLGIYRFKTHNKGYKLTASVRLQLFIII